MSENILPEVREWCDQRVAEAVRAEREVIIAVAENHIALLEQAATELPKALTRSRGILKARITQCENIIDAIRARECEGRPD